MWCCWISPAHNPASTQRRGRRAPNIGQSESLGSIRPPGLYVTNSEILHGRPGRYNVVFVGVGHIRLSGSHICEPYRPAPAERPELRFGRPCRVSGLGAGIAWPAVMIASHSPKAMK
jgi:hypothetical protein